MPAALSNSDTAYPLLVHLPLRDGDCCILYAEAADVAGYFSGPPDRLQKNIAADVVALPDCSFQHFGKRKLCPVRISVLYRTPGFLESSSFVMTII